MKRILLDATMLNRLDQGTGIQRVVRNILKESSKLNISNTDIVPIYWEKGQFKKLSERRLKDVTKDDRKEMRQNSPPVSIQVSNKHTAKRKMKAALPPKLYTFAGKVYFWARKKVSRATSVIPELEAKDEAVSFDQDDTLVLLDSSWEVPYWREVANAKNSGAKVGFVEYDIIPLRFPEYCDAGLIRFFRHWHKKVFKYADFSLSISNATSKDLVNFIKKSGEEPGFKPKTFKLGANIGHKGIRIENVDKEIQKFIDRKNTFTVVGTIEPRKNHLYVLEAFEKLWNRGIEVQLCFAGKWGWIDEKDAQRIKECEKKYSQFSVFTNVNDDELNFIYKNTRATIIASKIEGFGLPIIESLQHGTPVLASNIPVFQEVGGKKVNYFDINDSHKELSSLVDKQLHSPHKKLHSIDWPSWSEATQQFIGAIMKLR